MPTENRSSNTEMVSAAPAPKQRIYVEVRECEGCNHIGIDDAHKTLGACHECDWSGPEPVEDKCPGCERENVMAAACPDCGSRYVLAASKEFEIPPPQPHPEPIAWMVGTAIWWTQEEAERDAASTGLPVVAIGPMPTRQDEPAWFMTEGGVSAMHAKAKAMSDQQGLDTSSYCVPLYTHADPGEIERLRVELDEWKRRCQYNADTAHDVARERDTLHAQLAERDALLDRVVDHAKFWHDHPYAEVVEGIAKDYKALSASAVPSAPTPQTINGHKLNCKAVDDYKPGYCSCGAEPDSKS